MHHLNEGERIRRGSTIITNTLEEKVNTQLEYKMHHTNCTKKQIITATNLFEKCHGKLLVWDAVLGRADVLLGLIRDVEVDPHQKILLEKTHTDSLDLFKCVSEPIGFLVPFIWL